MAQLHLRERRPRRSNRSPTLIAYAKANPGKLAYGTPGIGTPQHVAGELLCRLAGIRMEHIPYRGANLADTMSGVVPLGIQNAGAAMPFVRDGRLRGIAVSSLKRSPTLPDLPTVAESGLPGLRGDVLVRADGARGHAARHRRQGECRGDAGAGRWRPAGPLRPDGPRAHGHDAGGDARHDRPRPAEMGQGDRRCRDPTGSSRTAGPIPSRWPARRPPRAAAPRSAYAAPATCRRRSRHRWSAPRR